MGITSFTSPVDDVLSFALRRQLEARIQELESLVKILSRGKYLWEATFDAIVEPVTIVDSKFNLQKANLAFAAASNEPVQKIIGKKCFQVFAKRKSPCSQCPMMTTEARQELGKMPDGQNYIASHYALKGKQSELDYHVLHYQNVSKIRDLEDKLIQSEKMNAIGLLASNIAHEINNPLGGILAFAQFAKKDVGNDSQTFQDLSEIEQSALSCKRIIEDLLHFSRPSNHVEKEEVHLGKVLEKILPLLKIQWQHISITIENEINPSTPTIWGSFNRLEQVFLNILANAFQASQDKIWVKISVMDLPQELMVVIEDQGKGIAPENLSKIFDPFFSTKERGKGSGLGLAICYQILQEHHGRIAVESKLGEGTTFKLVLPKFRK